MDAPLFYTTVEQVLENEGEKRVISLTWVKVNPACRTVPDTPLDFYIIRTKDEKGNWLML